MRKNRKNRNGHISSANSDLATDGIALGQTIRSAMLSMVTSKAKAKAGMVVVVIAPPAKRRQIKRKKKEVDLGICTVDVPDENRYVSEGEGHYPW